MVYGKRAASSLYALSETLRRRLARMGTADALAGEADLEEGDGPRGLPENDGGGAEDARAEGGAEALLLAAHGVRRAQGVVVGSLRADEGIRNRLLQAGGDEKVARFLSQLSRRLRYRVGHAARQRRAGDGVVADGAGDFLNDILLDAHVGAPVGRDDGHRIAVVLFEAEA